MPKPLANRRYPPRAVAVFTATLLPLTTSLGASAESCAKPDLEAAFPPDGASGVPLDATLSAIYQESADYLGEAVTLSANGVENQVTARFDPSERRLLVDAPNLEPSTLYTLTWPALRGLTTAGHGLGKTVNFTTGVGVDGAPPEFGGLTSLDWDLVHPRDECTDELEPRLRFRFGLGAASDDSGRDSLALLLFQTKGPALRGDAPRFVAGRSLPNTDHGEVDLTVKDAPGHVCFAAMVRDLVGNVSATGSDERCVKTTAPPIFYGCELRRRPSGNGVVAWLAFVGIGSLLARRRRAP